jgi:hypothetical protein
MRLRPAAVDRRRLSRQFDQEPAAVNLAEVNDLLAVFSDLLYASDNVRRLRQPVSIAAVPGIAGR